MSWYTSWLPSFPSIDFTLPSGIQRRFLSFVLKKSLGHFLRPGQLDVHQIDSQIGSGFVQVRDLELDNEAINAQLSGLPVRLHDGSISAVTARIPWPNPLTSTLGFSLESLHLTFHLVPVSSEFQEQSTTNIADSVTSIAESFIHDELNPHEEASLRESFPADLDSSLFEESNVPGGLNPFLSDEDDPHADTNPSGVSIFAALIERLLARFEFDAKDIRFTLVHPGNSSLTLSVQDIRYGTDDAKSPSEPDKGIDGGRTSGQSRTVTITGVTLTAHDLRPSYVSSPSILTPSNLSTTSLTTPTRVKASQVLRSLSPASSSSSLDDDIHLMMSQSLVTLPPRSSSPISSVASSMYQSAISTVSETETVAPDSGRIDTSLFDDGQDVEHPLTRHRQEQERSNSSDKISKLEDEIILSLGSEPIVIRITTPPPASDSNSQSSNKSAETEKLNVHVSIGALACAFRAWHIRSLIDISNSWGMHHLPASSTSASESPTTALGLGLEASIKLRGIVVLVLPTSTIADSLSAYWARPFVPPRLSRGYLRMHVDNIFISVSLLTSGLKKIRRGAESISGSPVALLSLSVNELSVFAFRSPVGPSTQEAEPFASPILITDQYLTTQYPPHSSVGHTSDQYPVFDTIDWTIHREGSAKVSTWRSKPRQKNSRPFEHRWYDGQSRTASPSSSPAKHAASLPSSPRGGALGLPSPLGKGRIKSDATSGESFDRPPSQKNTIMIKAKKSLSPSPGGKESDTVDVTLASFHVFADLGLVLSEGPLMFLDEVMGMGHQSEASAVMGENSEGDESDDTVEDFTTDSPHLSEQDRKRERERERLERLVLQDLDLDVDYRDLSSKNNRVRSIPSLKRQSKRKSQPSQRTSTTIVTVGLPMLRLELRCPPPPRYSPRSGSLVIDIHDINISFPPKHENLHPNARFLDTEYTHTFQPSHVEHERNAVVSAEFRRLVIASSLAGEGKATAILSLHSLPIKVSTNSPGLETGSSLSPTYPLPRILVNSDAVPAPSTRTTVLSFDVPSLDISLEKSLLDTMQLWADDVTQLLERISGGRVKESDMDEPDKAEGRDPSIIGSRFFAKSKRTGSRVSLNSRSSKGSNANPRGETSETIVKVAVSEASIRLQLPRDAAGSIIRPFDILASDIDILIELKPEGKDETVFTVGVAEFNVKDTSASDTPVQLLSLTSPRNLSSASRALLKLRFTSLIVPETCAKESKVKLTLWGFTYNFSTDFQWTTELAGFFKAPPGAFESVIPSERTQVTIKIMDGSIRAVAPNHPGSLLLYLGELEFSTNLVGDSSETSFNLLVPTTTVLFVDDVSSLTGPLDIEKQSSLLPLSGTGYWRSLGFALISEITDLDLGFKRDKNDSIPNIRVVIGRARVEVHLCADTGSALGGFIADLTSAFKPPIDEQSKPSKVRREPSRISEQAPSRRGIMSTLDENAFNRAPDIGPAPDMINDDLPTNLDYLDESFSAAAGLRELRDDDLDEFDLNDSGDGRQTPTQEEPRVGVVSNVGGETIKMLRPLHIIEDYLETLPPESADDRSEFGETNLRLRAHNCYIALLLYDGYDWSRTRKTIEDEVKEMRRRLAKIRQLVASGQAQDPSAEETSALLFNSVYIGLDEDVAELEPTALIAAIDEELNDDTDNSTQSSWQSLPPLPSGKRRTRSTRMHGKRLMRSKGPSIEFQLSGVDAEIDRYRPGEPLVSRTLVTVKDLEILDHVKTSTWRKFLTDLRSDFRGNVRETDSNMVRVELRSLHPVLDHPSEEARLRAKILPLRLYVDQDALDFLKKFFSFKDPNSSGAETSESSNDEIYFQHAEVFPIGLKLDYKPRRVDYRALREGKTIELMNFFHFDGAEMTLRHITLSGITGWPRLFDLLNDLWTPDVKATQLVDIISGVSPIRSVVNVGSGVADLVLLPIAQYKKDGRIVRGVQKGTKAFVKSTAMEAIKLGARLATGTQVILEQAENVLGGHFDNSITAEALTSPADFDELSQEISDEEEGDLISKYAEQPGDVREGVKSAYKSLQKNFSSAAQTILAVPMEVYERSGNEGPVRAVIRAVPIAVLRPMIGASEAVSKTLMGLQNTLDPSIRQENEAKYKQR